MNNNGNTANTRPVELLWFAVECAVDDDRLTPEMAAGYMASARTLMNDPTESGPAAELRDFMRDNVDFDF